MKILMFSVILTIVVFIVAAIAAKVFMKLMGIPEDNEEDQD